jgi:molybdenum cofactor cytidylyltransferase
LPAVVLAAGGSTRFGASKALARFEGRSLICIAVDAAAAGGCAPVTVVIGFDAGRLERAIDGPGVSVVLNRGWRRGVASSLRAGLESVLRDAPDTAGVLLMTCDQPLIRPETIAGLLHASQGGARPAVSVYADTVGVPAVVTRDLFPALMRLEGDAGAKSVLLGSGERLVRVPWPDGVHDVDRPEDLARIARARQRDGR